MTAAAERFADNLSIRVGKEFSGVSGVTMRATTVAERTVTAMHIR